MVKLNKIYTRTGDDGSTGLGTGQRVRKDSVRVEAYGTTDEAGAAIGLAVVACGRPGEGTPEAQILGVLRSVQHDLFDAGADLCTPVTEGEDPEKALRVRPEQTRRLEGLIDGFNADLAPLRSFVLAGGTPLAAALHAARTVVRRAERAAVSLAAAGPEEVNPEVVRYLNRLSDLLFVLARVANDGGKMDVLWEPGANRGS
jgi:cob(I)alamin adenosyltransferase